MITVNRPSTAPLIKFYVGTGGVKKGQLAKVDSSTAVIATEGISTAIVIGVACADYDAGEVGLFYDIKGREVEMDIYTGSTTDTFADSDIGKAFDIYHAGTTAEYFIDPNDTSGAMFIVQSYDNTRATAVCRIIDALCYV